jgi:hypothetical protein
MATVFDNVVVQMEPEEDLTVAEATMVVEEALVEEVAEEVIKEVEAEIMVMKAIISITTIVMDHRLMRIIKCKTLHSMHLQKAGMPNHIILNVLVIMDGIVKNKAGTGMDPGINTKEAAGGDLPP